MTHAELAAVAAGGVDCGCPQGCWVKLCSRAGRSTASAAAGGLRGVLGEATQLCSRPGRSLG